MQMLHAHGLPAPLGCSTSCCSSTTSSSSRRSSTHSSRAGARVPSASAGAAAAGCGRPRAHAAVLRQHGGRCRSSGGRRRCVRSRAQPEPAEEYDLVTRWVGKIFGKAAVEDKQPFGLKRMDWSQVKDLEVTTDRWAAPVATDDPLMARIRPLLAGTQLEEEALRCAYSATEDGWSAAAFHERVDGYGAALAVARTQGGAVCGGYNPLGYDGYGNNKSTFGAFLFTWPDGDMSQRPHKLPKVSTDQMAVVDGLDTGLWFGPGDFKVLLKRGEPTRATCKLIDYQRLPGNSRSLFNTAAEPGGKTELVELRVFVRKGGRLKYELDGLRWKSSICDDGSGEGPPTGVFTL